MTGQCLSESTVSHSEEERKTSYGFGKNTHRDIVCLSLVYTVTFKAAVVGVFGLLRAKLGQH